MAIIQILNREGKPLMPTVRCGHVRRMLKSGKARVISYEPFTVQLLYESPSVTQASAKPAGMPTDKTSKINILEGRK